MNFDLGVFTHDEAILWIPACLLLSYLVKMLPAWHLKKYFGRRKAIAAGFAMSTRLSLVVAAADIGVPVGALPPEMASAVVMVAVITCLISPVAFLTLVSRPSSARC